MSFNLDGDSEFDCLVDHDRILIVLCDHNKPSFLSSECCTKYFINERIDICC